MTVNIKNYEGLYSITRDGRIWSHDRVVNSKSGSKAIKKGKWMVNTTKRNYKKICLTKPVRQKKTVFVHRLVAQAFIPNLEGKPFINHKDGDKSNNHVDNLEWVTAKENQQHASKNGLLTSQKGEENGMSKLTWNEVNEIRKLKGKMTMVEIADRFNVSRGNIGLILSNKTWRIF